MPAATRNRYLATACVPDSDENTSFMLRGSSCFAPPALNGWIMVGLVSFSHTETRCSNIEAISCVNVLGSALKSAATTTSTLWQLEITSASRTTSGQ
eukprot:1780631-Rhodomonas_salina.1